MIPTGKKGKSKFQYPFDGNKGYPSYDNGKGKGRHDKGKSKTFAAIAEKLEEHPANPQVAELPEPTYAGWTDQDWDQSWNWNEQGWYSFDETSSTGQAHNSAHCPISLPIGLKKLRHDDDPDLIKSFRDILGSLMQPSDRPYVDHLASHEFTSSLTLNMLTLVHDNLTRNPKLDSREVKSMSIMKERPLIMMMLQNSAHSVCLNKADAFFYPEKSKDLIKLFIKVGYKGIVLKSWSAKPIACFVRGGKQARVELLARSQYWGTAVAMFRCYLGVEKDSTDPDYDSPTSDCLATTGPDMFIDQHKYIGRRLPPRTKVQGHGKQTPTTYFDSRHVTRADLPFATIGVFHPWRSTGRFPIRNHAPRYQAPMRCDYR